MEDNLVFTKEWLRDLDRRYAKRPLHSRPGIYSLVTGDENIKLRMEIEEWVALLDIDTRSKIIPRIRSEVNFIQTYNELAVGDVLRELGFNITYERLYEFENKQVTPDWYAVRPDGCEFVVEAFTLNVSRKSEEALKKWGYLLNRLKEINVGAILSVEPNDYSNAPDQRQVKFILGELKDWLGSSPSVGGVKFVEDIEFTIRSLPSEIQYLHALLYPNVFTVSSDTLRNNILEKTKKYRDLKSFQMRLIIAIVPNIMTGVGLEDLMNVLWGQETLVIDDWDRNISRLVRADGGLLAEGEIDSALSAVMWVPKKLGVQIMLPQVGIFPNPHAYLTLDPECMKTQKN